MVSPIDTLGRASPRLPSAAVADKGSSSFAASLGEAVQVRAGLQAAAMRSPQELNLELAQALRPALRAAGIAVPPALRIESGPNGPTLSGDPRAAAFESMLAGRPELRNLASATLGASSAQRAAALASAADHFLKHAADPRHASAVVDRYTRENGSVDISLRFDGGAVTAQERGPDGWRPLKTEDEFGWELAQASLRYGSDDQALFDSLMQAVSSRPAQGPARAEDGERPAKPLEPKDGEAENPLTTLSLRIS